VLFAAGWALLASAKYTQAQTVETGLVKLTGADIEYFSRGKGAAVVMLPGETLPVSHIDGLADALA
jgi:hypothetical protein